MLVVLVVFYILDDFRAQQELNSLHNSGLEKGVVFKSIAETSIRRTVVEEIERWQSFNPEAVENALRLKKG